jgi:GAF domain-containing protein
VAFNLLQALYFITERDRAVEFAMDMAFRLVPSQAGAILLYDPGAQGLYGVAARGPGMGPPMEYRVAMGAGLAGFCAKEGLPLALSYVDQDARFYSALSQRLGLGIASLAGAPVQYQGRIFGVLELVNRISGQPFSVSELDALALIARQLGERLATAFAASTTPVP